MKIYFCPNCGKGMRKETDTGIIFCPVDQIAFDEELIKELINMAVDLRDTANENLLGVTSP